MHILTFTLMMLISNCAQTQNFGLLNERPYNEVAFLTTHNSYNAKADGFWFPNQKWGIEQQLKDGVRGLMIDVYEDEEGLIVYHGYKALGSVEFQSILETVKMFLDSNKNEVVTLILECYAKTAKVIEVFDQAGLSKYAYTKSSKQSWPTGADMIENDKRLVVFTDNKDTVKSANWYHYVWDFAFETHFSTSHPKQLNCELNRGANGAREKDLFILNHFITRKLIGTGRKRKSKIVNSAKFLKNRIAACQKKHGKKPNFITVDFYNIGEGMRIVEALNNQ